MLLRTFAVAAVVTLATAGSALAQSQPFRQLRPSPDGFTFDIGAGVIYSKDGNGDTGSKTNVVPWVSANYRDIVYFTPVDGVGWNAVKTERFRVGVQLRPRFEAEDIEGLDLDRPGFGADLGAYAFTRLPGDFVVGGRISRDVTDVSEGMEYYASVSHQDVTPVGLLTSSLYVRGGDDKLADAYYGVSAAEATTNGIAAYSPDGGLQGAGLSLFLVAPIGDKWGVGGLLNYERRLGDVADSPLSQSDDTIRAGLFVVRRFGG